MTRFSNPNGKEPVVVECELVHETPKGGILLKFADDRELWFSNKVVEVRAKEKKAIFPTWLAQEERLI